MILLLILIIMATILISTVIFAIAAGGSLFIFVFGDVIVCIGGIIWLIVFLIKRRHR